MLWYSKIHAALIILCTWIAGLFIDKSVPYFPIEISRTGTGPYSSLIFKWGAVSLVVSLYLDGAMHIRQKYSEMLSSPVPIWGCLLVIAWFPDHTHLLIHGAGVILLMMCVLLNVLFIGDAQRRLPIVLTALGIESARMALKGYVVLFTELDRNIWSPWTYWNAIWNINGLRDEIVEQIMKIMYKGVDYSILPHLTIPVLRVTGVMQWLALYLMMCLY